MIEPRELTEEEKEMEKYKDKIRKQYGIPGLEFGDDETDYFTQQDKDYMQAELLMLDRKPFPPDLEKRLMEYKKEKEKHPAKKPKAYFLKAPWQ